MNISSHPVPRIDPVQQAQARAAIAGAAALGSGKPTEPMKGPVDIITLSDAAKAAIADLNKANGKAAESPAHAAREQFMADKIASGATGIDIRFGDVVSRIARGISTESLFGAAPKSGGGQDTTKIASTDGKAVTTTTPVQDENIVPTEANTAALGNGAPAFGEAVKIAATDNPVDILDLLSSDENGHVEVIV
jgi:hypothetical protein